MSSTSPSGQKPSHSPNWLRYLLLTMAIVVIGTALAFNVPEHQAEMIGLALVLITVLVKP